MGSDVVAGEQRLGCGSGVAAGGGGHAVAWCLAYPGVTATIVGARHPRHVDGWIDAPSVKLTTADLTTIADAVRRTGAGYGRI